MFFDWIQIALAIYFFARRTIARVALMLPFKASARCAATSEPAESAD
jgi:hypothetical protein